MPKQIHNSHDKFFKRAMSDVRVAKEFFEQHLPQKIKEKCDFNTLKFHKESFIDEELKLLAADVVYSANFNVDRGFIYVLAEHQSTVDKWIAFRIVRYMIRLLERFHKNNPQQALPTIYPLIFYSGETNHAASTNFFDLFGEHKTLNQELWLNPFQLIDVQRIDDKDLREYLWAGILEFILKGRRAGDFLQYIEFLMQWVHEIEFEQGYDYAKSVIIYTLDNLELRDLETAVRLIQTHLSNIGDKNMPTIAQYLGIEGLDPDLQVRIFKGMGHSMRLGRHEGLQQGEYLILSRLLKQKFSTIPEKYQQRLQTADAETLLNLAERIMLVATLEELFDE